MKIRVKIIVCSSLRELQEDINDFIDRKKIFMIISSNYFTTPGESYACSITYYENEAIKKDDDLYGTQCTFVDPLG